MSSSGGADSTHKRIVGPTSQAGVLLEASAFQQTGPSVSAADLWKCPSLLVREDIVFHAYGASVASYFCFVNHVTVALVFPSGLAAALVLRRYLLGVTIDDDPWMALYSAAMIVWSMLLLKTWRRRSAVLAHTWGVPLNGLPASEGSGLIPENLIGGGERVARWLASGAVTASALLVAGLAIVCSLNLQGYVNPAGVWLEQLFHVRMLAQLAEPGAIFDPNQSNWLLANVPTLLHVASILVLNKVYRRVAERLTEFERHECHTDAEIALAAKRFGFECFDCFGALFYIAFIKFDLVGVRNELISVYSVDQLRRVCLESLVPFLWAEMKRHSSKANGASTAAESGVPGKGKDAAAFEEAEKEEYEDFDDYLEMVIQLAYTLLFAVAFPMAASASLVCNVIEMKSDLFKLAHVVQKPPRHDIMSIGLWDNVLVGLCFLAAMTNSALFSLSSRQLEHFAPSLFHAGVHSVEELECMHHSLGIDEHSVGADLEGGRGRYVVTMCFAIEHVFLLVEVLLYVCIPDKPAYLRWAGVATQAKRKTE